MVSKSCLKWALFLMFVGGMLLIAIYSSADMTAAAAYSRVYTNKVVAENDRAIKAQIAESVREYAPAYREEAKAPARKTMQYLVRGSESNQYGDMTLYIEIRPAKEPSEEQLRELFRYIKESEDHQYLTVKAYLPGMTEAYAESAFTAWRTSFSRSSSVKYSDYTSIGAKVRALESDVRSGIYKNLIAMTGGCPDDLSLHGYAVDTVARKYEVQSAVVRYIESDNLWENKPQYAMSGTNRKSS